MDIAIIDSGVINKRTIGQATIKEIKNISMSSNSNIIEVKENRYAVCDHGTKVINTIEKYKKDLMIQYYIINIINDDGLGSSECLLEALKYICYMDNIKVVVMSLTFSNTNNNDKIERVCNKLVKLGKVIVAADSNEHKGSAPARFNSVIGVGRGVFKNINDYIYEENSKIQIIGDITPEFIPNGLGRNEIFVGTSKATAKMVPIIIKGIQECTSRGEMLEKYLKDNSSDKKENLLEQGINNFIEKKKDYTIYQIEKMINMINKFKESIGEVKKLEYIGENIPYNKILDRTRDFDLLLEFLVKTFKKDILVENINFLNFKSLFDIVSYFEEGD